MSEFKLPFSVGEAECVIQDATGKVLATCPSAYSQDLFDEAAEFMVRAANAHNELVTACKKAFEQSCRRSESRSKWTQRDQDSHESLKSALAKATGAA